MSGLQTFILYRYILARSLLSCRTAFVSLPMASAPTPHVPPGHYPHVYPSWVPSNLQQYKNENLNRTVPLHRWVCYNNTDNQKLCQSEIFMWTIELGKIGISIQNILNVLNWLCVHVWHSYGCKQIFMKVTFIVWAMCIQYMHNSYCTDYEGG